MNRFVAVCLTLLVAAGCSSGRVDIGHYKGVPGTGGSVARVERVGWYPAVTLRALFWYAAVPEPIDVAQGIDLYRVSYWSRYDGHNALLSGLLALPTGGELRGTVLYMHGTHTSRADSMSNPGIDEQESLLVAAAFAGGGYLTAAPDLSGLGISRAPQPYFINAATVEQTLDFLRAAQTVSHDLRHPWNPNLYIAGFSQGGHAAAVMQREFERRNDPAWKVRAVAGIAGPYVTADVEFPFAMKGQAKDDSTYLANLALSYSAYYRRPLESVMTPEMAPRARRLLDGDHTVDETLNGLPHDPRKLFNAEFLDALDRRQPNWFLDAMRANDAHAWAPAATFRAYYGERDLDATPQNSIAFAKEATRLGGHVEAIDVGPQDHGGSAFHAVPMARRWFDELSAPTVAH